MCLEIHLHVEAIVRVQAACAQSVKQFLIVCDFRVEGDSIPTYDRGVLHCAHAVLVVRSWFLKGRSVLVVGCALSPVGHVDTFHQGSRLINRGTYVTC